MPSISLVAIEARRLNKQLKETRRHRLQEALVELCEAHWQELRGPQPTSPLERALWSITPPWSDLLIDLYAAGDPRLHGVLPRSDLAQGLALLVLAEIERGNEAGVHIAHEPMMAFETAAPPAAWLERISSLLRGRLAAPPLHLHDSSEPLQKALGVIAVHTGRLDLPAVLEVISLLAETRDQSVAPQDEALETLRREVYDVGIRFLGIDGDLIHLEQHDHAHKPVRSRQLGEMLLELRRKRLR